MLQSHRHPSRSLAAWPRLRNVACLILVVATGAGGCARADDSSGSAEFIPQVTIPPPRQEYGVNVEQIYYSQYRLIAKATRALATQRPGITDLYFVGFAGDAEQDVFLREIRSVRQLFDDRFDTRGRSLNLVNNRATAGSEPLASTHNLLAALDQVSARMDTDEDVLFLYLTSHGTRGMLAVDFPPLHLNHLSAESLRKMLDQAQIKWRVIVISACYSGSFIQPLKTDTSLIITAARSDRVSFGCSNENDFTYFGRAYFNEALRHTYSFIDAEAEAVQTIAKWESAEDLKPSYPQIHIGSKIRPKLAEIETRLRRLHPAPAPTPGAKPAPLSAR
jgi:Peptidase C13 family